MINIMFEGGHELNIEYDFDALYNWLNNDMTPNIIWFLMGDNNLVLNSKKILWIKKIGN